jgi:hypothetical protein
MLTFFGILIITLAIAWLVLGKTIPKTTVEQDRQYNPDTNRHEIFSREVSTNMPKLLYNWKIPAISTIVGIILILLPSLFFFSNLGYNYVLVSPTGNRTVVTTEGIKMAPFCKITAWPKYIDIKVVDETVDGETLDELEGKMKPIDVRFVDQVTALAKVSVRFHLPEDPDKFLALAVAFKTVENLVQTTLIPTVKETMSNTAYMFAAQDYISGEAQSFRHTFEDQLANGSFIVRKQTLYDTVFEQANGKNTGTIKAIRTNYKIIKLEDPKTHKFQRIPNEITKRGVIVSQAIVDDVVLDPTFKERLKAQRDESAKRQLEQQKIKTAKDAQARILAEGERDKTAERVKYEKEQIGSVIALATEVKKQAERKKLAQIAYETAQINAREIKVNADAEAYKTSRMVSAGITPEVRLQMELDAKIAMMKALSGTKWPTTYISGGSGSKGADPINSLITAAMAKQLRNQ